MKIRIIKCLNGWYSNRIGEVFEVDYVRKFDGCYMVRCDDGDLSWSGRLSYVVADDCEIVVEE